ncbi:MAG TPA: DMT family transporter [bacterium]|jgi:drug/metabolite transporter (DMT)-like permease|nr:DMT family transporter [bacterium]HOB70507.1 DMT family transporter [bacterium]HOG43701.1 DMT family transporter [bacterium]HPG36948.1 DMT family transporter [bacterium]HPM45440.1 DMT family transporter [bacterium]
MSDISYFGEIAAISASLCWSITSLAFESAGKRVGSLQVNIIRLVLALFFLSGMSFFANGQFFPFDATPSAWFWLTLSGVAGFLIGDLLLFQALVVIGSRISMLIMTLAPVFTAILAKIILGEELAVTSFLGMMLTISGIIFVISGKKGGQERKITKYGLSLAVGGAMGQALGLVLSKLGMKDYSAISSTQIRVIAGIIGFSIIFTMLKKWGVVISSIKNISAMKRITTGAFFGPFMGVTFSLLAVQHTNAGIAATLMSLAPVFIIVPSRFIFKEKIKLREIAGAVIAFSGVAVIFLF